MNEEQNCYLGLDLGRSTAIAVGCHRSHGVAGPVQPHLPEPPLLVLVVLVALVLLAGVEVRPVHRLDVLPQRARVGVPLGAARGLAHVRLLQTHRDEFQTLHWTFGSVVTF